MPNHRLSRKERETKSATFMLTKNHLSVNRSVWTANHGRLIKRAASYREVQRVLVHPAIKKELCETAGTDRSWLSKVRPVRGHNYHFHIRIRCPPGSPGPHGLCPSEDVNCDNQITGLDVAVVKSTANWQLGVGAAANARAPKLLPLQNKRDNALLLVGIDRSGVQ